VILASALGTDRTPQFARLGLGAAADATHLLLLSAGTITTDKHLIDGAVTWNAGGVTFTADKINVTNTASAAASLLWDRQVGGTSQGKLDRSGNLTVTTSVTAPTVNATTWNTPTGTDAAFNGASGRSVTFTLNGGGGSYTFNKTSGNLGSGLSTAIIISTVGSVDTDNPYWNGVQYGGHAVTETIAGTQFPRFAYYARSSGTSNPTDYEWYMKAWNTTATNQTLTFASFVGSQTGQTQGAINFQIGNISTSPTILQITSQKNVVVGEQAALSTSATNGFLYIPTMAGAPTGDPADFTGKVPLVWDSTNSKLCVNTSGSTWKCVTLN
jgi:hypothetical protein